MRDRCEIGKDKEIKDATDKNEVAQLGLSPLQDGFKGNCEVDCEIDCEIDYEAEIYIIGGYDRLINKLRAKFVNIVSDEKGCKGFVGKERVFILTGYVSHADIYKIENILLSPSWNIPHSPFSKVSCFLTNTTSPSE